MPATVLAFAGVSPWVLALVDPLRDIPAHVEHVFRRGTGRKTANGARARRRSHGEVRSEAGGLVVTVPVGEVTLVAVRASRKPAFMLQVRAAVQELLVFSAVRQLCDRRRRFADLTTHGVKNTLPGRRVMTQGGFMAAGSSDKKRSIIDELIANIAALN